MGTDGRLSRGHRSEGGGERGCESGLTGRAASRGISCAISANKFGLATIFCRDERFGNRPTSFVGSLNASVAALAKAYPASLPRPMLSRLVTRMIERIDEIDGDPEVEGDNED